MKHIRFAEVNDEVLFNLDAISKVTREDVEWLKTKALRNARERVRLCAHRAVDDPVHEMLIVHTKGTYVRPHKHPNKSESFHIIEGALDIVIFNDRGEVLEVINMGEYSSGARFYWRLSESYYHMVIPRTEMVVFHETTGGPFDPDTSKVQAPWSPSEDDLQAQARYMARLGERPGKS